MTESRDKAFENLLEAYSLLVDFEKQVKNFIDAEEKYRCDRQNECKNDRDKVQMTHSTPWKDFNNLHELEYGKEYLVRYNKKGCSYVYVARWFRFQEAFFIQGTNWPILVDQYMEIPE